MSENEFESVWDAIEDTSAEAENMKARSQFMLAIQDIVERWNVTQAEAAKRLGLTQPRMNDLLRGRIDRFSLDALMNIASAAGLTIEWRVTRKVA
jgi:predicted XRE-type DNA-binding protein